MHTELPTRYAHIGPDAAIKANMYAKRTSGRGRRVKLVPLEDRLVELDVTQTTVHVCILRLC